MSHILRWPNAGAPSVTVTFNPARVTIQDQNIEPVQRYLEAADGTQLVFVLSSNRKQTYEMIVEGLHSVTSGGFSGYNALLDFFQTTTNWMEKTFQLTHDDGETVTVRIVLESWQFTEDIRDFWNGRVLLKKSF